MTDEHKTAGSDVLILFNRGLFVCFLPHILALFIDSDTDCSAQNGSTHGCVFPTLKNRIVTSQVEKSSDVCICLG